MYTFGDGVAQDHAEAVRWYRKAADQDNVNALFNLGVQYDKGQGVREDYTEAAKYYRKAADQGLGQAQFNLGLKYKIGQGVAQDCIQAHMWFNLAGAAGNADAVEERDKVAREMTQDQIAKAQRLAREWKPKASR
jgi:TPR repeat protein